MLEWLAFLRDGYVHLLMLLVAIALLATLGSAIPSRRLIVLLLVPIVLAAFAFFYRPLMLVLEFYNVALFIVMLMDRFLISVDQEQIEIRRSLTPKFSINQDNPVIVHLYNNSVQTVDGWLVDEIPEGFHWGRCPHAQTQGNSKAFRVSLEARKRLNVEYNLKPKSRGSFSFGRVHLRYRSKLGLLWIIKKAGREDKVRVYPDLKRMREMRVRFSKSQNVGELRKRVLGSDGTDFAGLRTYLAGDDIRKIDWKATARMDVPIVQTYSPEVDQPILVLLDAGRKMQGYVKGLRKFDWALNAALAFASVAIDRGDQVGIGVFHQDVVALSNMAGGRSHLNRLLESLHDVRPEPIEPAYERVMVHCARSLKRRSLVVIFTDLIDPMASRSLVRSLQVFSQNHLLVVVTLSDSEMQKIGQMRPDSAFEVYEKGVALDLINIRKKTLRELVKGFGAIVIDTSPEKMDEDLINRYLAVKLKNRL